MAMKTSSALPIFTGTIYRRSIAGYSKLEARNIAHEFIEYAQYRNALRISLLPKRGRRGRYFIETFSPSVVIIEGWGHPYPFNPVGRSDSEVAHLISSKRQLVQCAESDFNSFLQFYIRTAGVNLLQDFRGIEVHQKRY